MVGSGWWFCCNRNSNDTDLATQIRNGTMKMDDYQLAATAFAQYDDIMYPVASLMVESAELADLFIKPMLRGDNVEWSRSDIVKEAGDVLWNLSLILRDNEITLSEVAVANIHKLQDRLDRNVIKGSGGNR